jgi:hypothetical protein
MSALAIAPRLLESPEPYETLDDAIARVWEALLVRRSTACPMCGDAMLPVAGETIGCCRACGTVLV